MAMAKNHSRTERLVEEPRPSSGVQISLVSRRMLGGMTTTEKIRFILDEVKCNKVLVLEQGLDPREEAQLIQTTMTEIDPDTFIGIEMESHQAETPSSWMQKLLAKTGVTRSSMSVVGPADKLRTVHKDGSTIQALILTGTGKGA